MAGIDSLYASSAYGQAQTRDVTRSLDTISSAKTDAAEFTKAFEVKFNNYANLSPAEILNKIKASSNISSPSLRSDTRSSGVTLDFSSAAAKSIAGVREALLSHEAQAQKASIGEANLVELMTSSTNARNSLKVMSSFIEEGKAAWEKIFALAL